MTARWFSSRNTSARRLADNKRATVPQAKTYGTVGHSRTKTLDKLVTDPDGIVHRATTGSDDGVITACGRQLPNHGAGRKVKSPTCIGCLAL
jgi:hypothetical protein